MNNQKKEPGKDPRDQARDKELMKLLIRRELKNMYEIAKGGGPEMAVEVAKNAISNNLMEPKELVTEIGMDPKIVLNAINQNHNCFSPDSLSAGAQEFLKSCGSIFENEEYFESNYFMNKETIGEAAVFDYQPASRTYLYMFYQIYKYLSGKEYASPEQLKDNFSSAVKGRKFLEIGCGPGFALRVLKSLGAEVAGIEILTDHKDRSQGLNIEYGDASDILSSLRQKFDVIFSMDVFTTTILPTFKAAGILMRSGNLMHEDSVSIHQIVLGKMHPELQDFMMWMNCREKGLDYNELKRAFDSLPENVKEEHLYTNHPSLSEEELKEIGFDVVDHSNDGWFLNIVLKKG
jgi:hypothetical protein